ncbi:YeeE/YedE thiosulfate transporter family protein [Haliea sp. E1-2-M8]|uniref:YeeE/YedE thiosulfate transporter family protein n=1 Tax=Haliea sp. E1-2-M8 TaxID=3064706 RepID=UPI0027250AC1|nr:YeeE/YedE thiosulfate transporter family protein [Haliea sp. E1-2-M8]MDO8861640.1 YeeE/YedE thiosulfate transporter family protein [Haliea sp. E1-2-M8]
MEYEGGAWSPYLVGALIGVLSMATFYFSDKPLGISTAYARLAGLVGNLVAKNHTGTLKFYQDKTPKIEWGVMLLFGVVLGAFIAAYTGGEIAAAWVPPLWQERFGPEAGLRAGVAFLGGVIMAYGARLAGGCTSGHGISGALQLSVSSWLAMLCFFAGAVVTAMLLFGL